MPFSTALVLALAFVASAAGAPQTAGPCDVRWSRARPIVTERGQPVYVERPDIVTSRRATALIGSPTYIWATPTAFQKPGVDSSDVARQRALIGVLLGSSGKALPLAGPPGFNRFIAPRGAWIGDTLAVFWGESADTRPFPFQVEELWFSEYYRGHWTPAERLLASPMILWTTDSNPVVMGGSHPSVSVAAYTPDPSAKHGIAHTGIAYIERRGSWRTSWAVDTWSPPAIPQLVLIPAGGDTAIIALVGLTPTADISYGVFVVRSTSTARKWGEPRLVSDLGPQVVSRLRAGRLSDGSLVLAWMRRLESEPSSTSFVAYVPEAGRPQMRMLDPKLSGRPRLEAQTVLDGALLVAARTDRLDSLIMLSLSPALERSTVLAVPPSRYQTALGITPRGDARVVWSADSSNSYPGLPSAKVPLLFQATGACPAIDRLPSLQSRSSVNP